MHLAYVVYGSPTDQNGVPEKIRAWARSLRRFGRVTVVWITNDRPVSTLGENDEEAVIGSQGRLEHVLATTSSSTSLLRRVRNYLAALHPDIVYVRYPLYRLGLRTVLKSVAPYVIELNGDPRGELSRNRRWVHRAIEGMLGPVLLSGASGFVGVTSESVGYGLRYAARPAIVIGNGVDCEILEFLPLETKASQWRLAYVGTRGSYDGLDRLWRAMLDNPVGACRFKVDIVGRGWESDPLLRRVRELTSVRMHGFVEPGQLAERLRGVDLGIGPLAPHRIGRRQATSLKVRRYLAHGMPVVIAFQDPELPESLPFVMQASPDERALDLEALAGFAEAARDVGLRIKAREYAQTHLSYEIKARTLWHFLADVYKSQGSLNAGALAGERHRRA